MVPRPRGVIDRSRDGERIPLWCHGPAEVPAGRGSYYRRSVGLTNVCLNAGRQWCEYATAYFVIEYFLVLGPREPVVDWHVWLLSLSFSLFLSLSLPISPSIYTFV